MLKKVLFKEKIDEWKIACLPVNAQEENRTRIPFFELREEKKRTKQLERELRQKEKELAEVALLLLRKKTQAIWGDLVED